MNVQIIDIPLSFSLHGFSGLAENKDYASVAFSLSDKMWRAVKSNNLKNKGLNVWVYEQNESVFAGVELNDVPNQETGLEQKTITLLKYAYFKHVGPYKLIKHAGQEMRDDLKRKGFETISPNIEIYGHWTKDESKLETELLSCLK